VAATAKVAVSWVPAPLMTALLAVTPDGTFRLTPARFVPAIVTRTFVSPCAPMAGVIEVMLGEAGLMANDSALLFDTGVVTAKVTVANGAVASTVNVAVIFVLSTTITELAVMPAGIFRLAPVKPDPVIVTGTLVPGAADAGAIFRSCGPLVMFQTALGSAA